MDREARRMGQGLALAGVAVTGAILFVLLVVMLREILAIIFLGFIVGITLLPVTERAQRLHLPRVLSVLLIYGALAGLVALFLWYAIPTVASEAEQAVERIDELEAWYTERAEQFGLPALEELTDYVADAADALLPELAEQALLVTTVLGYMFLILVVALFLTINQQGMRDTLLSAVSPEYRRRTDDFLSSLAHKLRRYVFATLINMTIVGVVTFIGLTIIGIPFAFLLAVLAFLFEILPIVGPWIAFAPAFAVALTQGTFEAIAVAVFYLVVQQLESYVLVPVIYGRETKVPNLMLLIAIMIGFPLMGVLGAIIALPISIIIYTLFNEVLLPWRRRQIEANGHPAGVTLEDAEVRSANEHLPSP